mmetsp:Transcript_85242/g.155351  ORF Transcript_85242/g.155351 Transcript_85242/m.155351 type:complete len:624 (+) Transcript_85242:36-1907(+)
MVLERARMPFPPRRGGHVVAGVVGVSILFGADGFDWSMGLSTMSSADKKHATDELTGSNFDSFLKDHPVTAVLFYAPWCFYSQQIMPAWDQAGQKLAIHDPPVHVAKIDAHKYGMIGDKFGVNAFPTMKLFVDGAVFDYDNNQGRGWQQIVKWVNRHLDRDHVLKNVEDADHYLNDNDLSVIGLFPDGMNNTIFAQSARHFDDISFAEARGTEVSKNISGHLARHALLACETIDVGQGHKNTKEVTLPREHMSCSDQPRNPQRPEWTDRYKTTVSGQTVKVQRTDNTDGWQQMLQIRCCDQETDDHKAKARDIPVPSIVMFMPHDERFARYEGGLTDIHALDKWISARRTPMVMRLTSETADKILDTGPEKTPVLFLISNKPEPALENEFREAAKLLRGTILVCFAGTMSPIEKRLQDLAGAEEDSLPVATLIEAHAGGGPYHTSKKYRIDTKGLKSDAIVKFAKEYEKGSLKPWLKSEPEPQGSTGPVGVLVGTNFYKEAHDEAKDVLVDFYAPWCGHCRKFEPNYKNLARKLRHVKSLKITKIDATRNEVEGMTIMGFPTIILFAAGKEPKRQVTYQGNRSPEDMTRWLHDHCSIKFDDRPTEEEAPHADSGLLTADEEDL